VTTVTWRGLCAQHPELRDPPCTTFSSSIARGRNTKSYWASAWTSCYSALILPISLVGLMSTARSRFHSPAHVS
jgi:hypothetical protein